MVWWLLVVFGEGCTWQCGWQWSGRWQQLPDGWSAILRWSGEPEPGADTENMVQKSLCFFHEGDRRATGGAVKSTEIFWIPFSWLISMERGLLLEDQGKALERMWHWFLMSGWGGSRILSLEEVTGCILWTRGGGKLAGESCFTDLWFYIAP